MEYKKSGNLIVIRVDCGEEIVSSVESVCKKEKVKFGSITGIGAVDHVVIGLYRVTEKLYHSNTFDGEMEMTSLLGNASVKDGKPYLHFHANFAGPDGKVIGGHLNEAIVSGTAEIFIHTADSVLGRRADAVTGLNIFDF
jgi:hypothetical protein